MVFGEKLPPLWWVGAMGLVVGNVVIGRRDSGAEAEGHKQEAVRLQNEPRQEEEREQYTDEAEGGGR